MMWFICKCKRFSTLCQPQNSPRIFQLTPGTEQTYAAALFHTGWFVESLMTQTLYHATSFALISL